MYRNTQRRLEAEDSKPLISVLSSHGPFLYLCTFEHTPDAGRQALGTTVQRYGN